MPKTKVSKAYPMRGITPQSIIGAINNWCGEENTTPESIHHVEVKPTVGIPNEIMGVTIVQDPGAIPNTIHVKAN